MTIEEMINTYRIALNNPTEQYRMGRNLPLKGEIMFVLESKKAKKDGVIPFIKEHKQEIIDTIHAQREEHEKEVREYSEKLHSIPGLAEIEKSDEEWAKYNAAWNRTFNSEDAAIMQSKLHKPTSDPEALRKKYPQAAAYLEMEALRNDSNYSYASIGRKALDMVIDGNWEEALRFAETEKKKIIEKHLWD